MEELTYGEESNYTEELNYGEELNGTEELDGTGEFEPPQLKKLTNLNEMYTKEAIERRRQQLIDLGRDYLTQWPEMPLKELLRSVVQLLEEDATVDAMTYHTRLLDIAQRAKALFNARNNSADRRAEELSMSRLLQQISLLSFA